MPHHPSPDMLDDLRRLTLNPYWLTNVEMKALIERAIEEIEVLRMLADEAARDAETSL